MLNATSVFFSRECVINLNNCDPVVSLRGENMNQSVDLDQQETGKRFHISVNNYDVIIDSLYILLT